MGGQRVSQKKKSTFEPFPQKIEEISELLSRLGREERAIQTDRWNKDVRQQHERQAEQVRQQLLAQADYSLVYNYLEATGIADKNLFRTAWQRNPRPVGNTSWLPFVQSYALDLTSLPFGSLWIRFEFKLLKPYISRDDNQFYIVDNPIVREKVFRLPVMRPTAWKGSLRHALWQLGHQEDNERIRQLFGAVDDEQSKKGNSGRLYLYPSFFTQTGLEVINPHDRETGAGSQPILIESVPTGATGIFTLLYTPLDRIGADESETRQQVAADLQLIAAGLEALFTVYGFGAKTSSGFGLASDSIRDGEIVIGGLVYQSEPSLAEAAPSAPPQPDLPRYLAAPGKLHFDFASDTGELKSEAKYQQLLEGRGQSYGKKDKQLYEKAKKWWEREGKQLAQSPEPQVELDAKQEAPPSYPLARELFDRFSDLPAKAHKLANALCGTRGSS
jgi:CRISPR-associated protein Cmr2